MIPRPVIGQVYDPGGENLTVESITDLFVVCSCAECAGIPATPEHYREKHVWTRDRFFAAFKGYGPFLEAVP